MNVRPPEVPPVHRIILDNGVTVLVREDHSAPVVSAQLWVRTGSIDEGPLIGSGLSHFLEHMFFKGSSNHPAARLVQEVQDRGGRMNAYTSFDRTVFYVDIPSRGWRTAVEILADAVQNPLFPEEEFARERDVILREIDRGMDEPARRLSRLLWSTAYVRHPYRYPVIGYRPLVEAVTRDEIIRYFRARYVPDNLTLVLVGDLRTADAESVARETFGRMKREPAPQPFIPREPMQTGPRVAEETMDVRLARIAVAFPSVALPDPDVPALDLLATILGDGRGSRLYRRLREEKELAHQISAWSYTPADPGLFGITAVADPDRIDALRTGILEEIEAARKAPPSERELEQAVRKRTADWVRGEQTMSGQARDIGEGELSTANPRFDAVYLEALAATTPAEVLRVARRYLDPSRANWAVIRPAAPSGGTSAEEAAEETAARPDPLEQATLERLENGVRVILIEDHRLPLVEIRAVLPAGVLLENDRNNGITALTARLLLKGTERRTAEQITDAIESQGGLISAAAGNNTLYVSLSVLSEQTPTAVDLLGDVLLHPTFPEDAFARERDAQIAAVRAEKDQILQMAQRLLRETVFGRHPYRLSPSGQEKSLEGLTRRDVVDFHRRILRGDELVVAIAGDFRPEAALNELRKALGNVPSGTGIPLPEETPAPIRHPIEREWEIDRQQAVVLVGFVGVDVASPMRPALDVISTALSGQGTGLFERIREDRGLAYYVGAFQFTGLHPGLFALYAGTTPEAAGTVRDELLAEVERIRTAGLGPEELERARNRILGGIEMRRQQIGDRALQAALDELYGLGYDDALRLPDRYRAVGPDDVLETARRILRPDACVVTIVRPPVEPAPAPEGSASGIERKEDGSDDESVE